ncbi:hypothetical protein COOONC_13662, partial [Cooperia oncophora]
MVDPMKQNHAKILRMAGIDAKTKRGLSPNGMAIYQEVTANMDKYDRPPQKKDKIREKLTKQEDKGSKKSAAQPKDHPREPYTNVPKDEFCMVADRTIEIDKNDLIVNRLRTLGKGAFGAVYAGEYR